jgi:uncharacterized membrane protein
MISSQSVQAASALAGAPARSVRAYRLPAIDIMRGLVIVIMALDHVRDYFMAGSQQDPMSDPNVTPLLFFTRWITHFCAPVFVLLAGTSAGLMAERRSPKALGAFLLGRGLWLIAIEWFVISTAWTFAPLGLAQFQGRILVPMQVIWAIGASMVVLAGAQFLGRRACLLIGLAIVLGHNLLDGVWPASRTLDLGQPLWVALHAPMSLQLGPYQLIFAYPLLPWIGVMLLGFGIAPWFTRPAQERDPLLRRAGVVLTLAFVALRALDVYGDPHGWSVHAGDPAATVMAFLNTTKYPPSLLFLLMTLGPAALLASYTERLQGVVRDTLVMFGRVPFAFYVSHLYLIHALSLVLAAIQGFTVSQFLTFSGWFPKDGYGLPLSGVYAVWLLVVALLYPFCRWVAELKARRNDWWLSYL